MNEPEVYDAEIVEDGPMEAVPDTALDVHIVLPLVPGDIVHVVISHPNKSDSCHAALITDTDGPAAPYAWLFPCGSCNPAPQRVSILGVTWHKKEECPRVVTAIKRAQNSRRTPAL